MSLDATAIDKIAGLVLQAAGKVVDIGGRQYTPIPLQAPKIPLGPEPAPITFRRLSSMAEYLKANRDKLVLDALVLHVSSATAVELLGGLQAEPYQRFKFAVAIHEEPVNHDAFEDAQSLEDAIVQLQVGFAPCGQRDELLALLSNVKDENVSVAEDDGVTQVVTVKAGAVLKGLSRVPNPVELRPYRTFREIEQPYAKFVVRVQRSGSGLPTVRIIPADGDTWKLQATDAIADYLRQNVPNEVKVLS